MASANMAARLSIPVASTSRRLAGSRMFCSSSCALVSPRIAQVANSSDPKLSVESKARSTESLAPLQDPSIPETPESKSLYRQSGPKPPRRPGVKPPPTLVLPSSMLPPPPQIPLPMSLPGNISSEVSEAHEKTYHMYLKSLETRNEEPTLEDLDALRPPPSTVRAALEGVIGSGRALLPAKHPLHLAIKQLGALEASTGGGPNAKKTVVAGSRKAKKLEYQALYAATEGMITRGFTVVQLKQFERETKKKRGDGKVELPPGKITSKPRIIHNLMNLRWGMIHPKVVEKYLVNESEPIEKSYQVSPSELFIFLGRDGEDLLHLAKKLKMRINVDRETLKPPPPDHSTTRPGFIIRAFGTQPNHEKLRKYIENQRDTMTVRIVRLPTGPPLSPSLLQGISRIAGAFVENVDPKFASLHDDKSSAVSVSIAARSPRSAYTAERLVQRAAMEAAHRSQLSIFALLKDEKGPTTIIDGEQDSNHQADRYALYPFDTQGFRVRSVQQMNLAAQQSPNNNLTQLPLTSTTLDLNNYEKDEAFILTGEDLPKTEPQVTPKEARYVENMTARNVRGEVIDLREHILGKNGSEGERIITATFGHVVFKTGKSTVLDPPLPQPVSSKSILEWADKHDPTARAFVPSQVPVAPIPNNVTIIHRLQYRTIEGKHIINVDVELPGNDVEPSPGETGNTPPENNGPADELEVSATESPAESANEDDPISSEPNTNSELAEERDVDSAPPDPLVERTAGSVGEYPPAEGKADATEFTPLPVEIAVGTETAFELMLPGSTMDIYVQVSHTTSMARSMVPEVLEVYLDGLSKFFTTDIEMPQPDPPQYLNFDGQNYILVKNTSARIGISTFAELPHECTVTSESSLDLEKNVPTTFTQLIYRNEISEKDWDGFIGACETLASRPYYRSTELRVNPT
ncbi:hypothetical protein ACGC1H_006541 [Rhizoctonia solani]|uniref:Uncharacterized protein n=1 Tax=Rhizoctonia solani TaxID=456999 RepID=A0A8H2XYR8_9AGAM|nr:unnamed protein product [Rhizoctonia solani]